MTELLTKAEAMTMHMWEREIVLHNRGCPDVAPQYCIVWEDPYDLDAPVQVTTPSPRWLGLVMHGNYTCDIDVFLRDVKVEKEWRLAHPDETWSWKKAGGAWHPYTKVIGAMTEKQAIEYCMMWSVPEDVWSDTISNRPRFRICKRVMVPADRSHRNAWRFIEENLAA